MRRMSVLALSFLLGAAHAQAQPGVAHLKVEVAPAEITVGDRVEAKVTLVWMGPEPASAPRFPTWQENWGQAEVLAAGEVEAYSDQSARRIYRQMVTLTAFEPGKIELPRITIALPLADETLEIAHDDDVGFDVRSVLPEDGEEELVPRDAAPLQPLADGLRFLWAAGAFAGFGLLAAWLLWRRLAGMPAGPVARPLLEPLEELIERLRRLDPVAGEPAHTGLSHGLRHFLGRSLGLPAVESTTTEIGRRLHQTPVTSDVAQNTIRLLRDCDQVKFARAQVDAALTEGRLLEARQLAHEIDDGLRPPEPADPAEATG